MSEGGDRIDVWAGPSNEPTHKEREEHEATHVPFRDWCKHCVMGRGHTHHHITKQKSEDQSRRPTTAMDHSFMKMKSVVKAQTMSEEAVTCVAVK